MPGTSATLDITQIVTQQRALATGRPHAAPTTLTTTLNANHTPDFKMNRCERNRTQAGFVSIAASLVESTRQCLWELDTCLGVQSTSQAVAMSLVNAGRRHPCTMRGQLATHDDVGSTCPHLVPCGACTPLPIGV
ncbi:hypothetical protein HaLaN_02525 [Haematococcus lacustris]|uniref:Uncharacterized protein n=1 Tax=Haematococcus lacustris TaxID=44745 RepID=A0A699YBX8_HAELA|nr:hypothetical protein HaLaN_02525 [Haematococcus lacustris]